MNEHIELVKEWLADTDSVSLEELKANSEAAWAAYVAAGAAWATGRAADVAVWVKKYEEITNDK